MARCRSDEVGAMDKKINVIRSQGNKLLTEDYLALSTLLIKAGYTVRITTREVPGKKTKEKVIEFWEDGANG